VPAMAFCACQPSLPCLNCDLPDLKITFPEETYPQYLPVSPSFSLSLALLNPAKPYIRCLHSSPKPKRDEFGLNRIQHL